jgi:hypothetical protein
MTRPPNNHVSELSANHYLLLAVHYAYECDFNSLRTLSSSRQHVLPPELLLRCILTFVPDTCPPEQYISLIDDISHDKLTNLDDLGDVSLEVVENLSNAKASKRVKDVHLLPLPHPSFPVEDYPETLVQFIIHRSHQIDENTGLLSLVSQLILPFVERYSSLKLWYISCVLPLLRVDEHYPQAEKSHTLSEIEVASDAEGPLIWLQRHTTAKDTEDHAKLQSNLLWDLKNLLGPWLYGAQERQKRRIARRRISTIDEDGKALKHPTDNSTFSHVASWNHTLEYLVQIASKDFRESSTIFEEWGGPVDIDLDGWVDQERIQPMTRKALLNRYCQTILAAIYRTEKRDNETISSAYRLVIRVSYLLELNLPPSLEAQLEDLGSLPAPSPSAPLTKSSLDPDKLLDEHNILTVANEQSLLLARRVILTTKILTDFGHAMPISNVLTIRFFFDEEDQSSLLHQIIHFLSANPKISRSEWPSIRRKLLWLWGWGGETSKDGVGYGVFGKMKKTTLEKDILEGLVSSGSYSEVVNLYISDTTSHSLSPKDMEQVIISTALQQYDQASNGNRTRGHMKTASDIVTHLGRYYPDSMDFRRTKALINAAHQMSSYSLTLQHGVPFQPVSIRVTSDPISLIEKILSQNTGSYARLQDLVSIGKSLVEAGLTDSSLKENSGKIMTPKELETGKNRVSNRIIGMAVEAALQEDDFETAYSYVVNWLDTSSAISSTSTANTNDDIAWRAALAAGKHKSSANSLSTSTSSNAGSPPALRRLEQRMDLLSQALLLAPANALPEILGAWRKCEEEMTTLLVNEANNDASFDLSPDAVPGAFISAPVHTRREVGRGAGEEAPMGLFDVARGAAQAFSRSAFPLHGAASNAARQSARPASMISSDGGSDAEGQGRVRRRDMVASAVTGGLASGLGWVLGANPVPPTQK